MRKIVVAFIIICFFSCSRKKENISDQLNLTDNFDLNSIYSNEIKENINYKTKIDSILKVINNEIDKADYDTIILKNIKLEFFKFQEANSVKEKQFISFFKESFGNNYREIRNDNSKLTKLKYHIDKSYYNELLLLNYSLRINVTRWREQSDNFKLSIDEVYCNDKEAPSNGYKE